MNRFQFLIIVLLLSGFTLAEKPAKGSDEASKFNFRYSVGLSVPGEVKSEDILKKSDARAISSLGLGKLKYDFSPGVRASFEPEYRFAQWFGVGLETGVLYNDLKSLEFAGFKISGIDGSLIQVPLLLNANFYVPVTAYNDWFVGVGVGGLYSAAEATDKNNIAGLSEPAKYSSDLFNLAEQFRTGFNWRLQYCTVYLSYELLNSDNLSNGIDIISTVTHSASVGVQIPF